MIDTKIAKTNGKNKVIDFCDNLILANNENYANMHGMGGKGHAPNSTIKIRICDYSNGTGDKSINVSANVAPHVIAQLYTVVQSFMNSTALTLPVISQNGIKTLNSALEMARTLVKSGNISANEIISLGKELKAGMSEISTQNTGTYIYSQDKVNTYAKADENGKFPVNRLVISRDPITHNGEISRYPWRVKITNGVAPVTKSENGATTYNAKSLQVTGGAFINISDADFFRMLYRTTQFINAWENANCLKLILEAQAARSAEKTNKN